MSKFQLIRQRRWKRDFFLSWCLVSSSTSNLELSGFITNNDRDHTPRDPRRADQFPHNWGSKAEANQRPVTRSRRGTSAPLCFYPQSTRGSNIPHLTPTQKERGVHPAGARGRNGITLKSCFNLLQMKGIGIICRETLWVYPAPTPSRCYMTAHP